MIRAIFLLQFISLIVVTLSHPHIYNPYENYFGYSSPYSNPWRPYSYNTPYYSPVIPSYTNDIFHDRFGYLPTPNVLPTLNVLAQEPCGISNKFTVVPMLLMSKENMKMVSNGQITGVSRTKPQMTIKTEKDDFLQCTPAVRIVLEKPIVVYSLKSNVVFPTEVEITHQGFKIPIQVGAVIAPINQNTFVSFQTPAVVRIVYAVPTKPLSVDYINNEDAIFVPETEAVVVESENPENLPPKNVTELEFPDKEAEPSFDVDEEDDELVNRNPPQLLVPAGIVQSTQPHPVVHPFVNSKESAVLHVLREQSKKKI